MSKRKPTKRAVDPTITRRTAFADLPELLTVPEAAVVADMSPGAIYEAIRSGSLPFQRFGAKCIRVPKSALKAGAA